MNFFSNNWETVLLITTSCHCNIPPPLIQQKHLHLSTLLTTTTKYNILLPQQTSRQNYLPALGPLFLLQVPFHHLCFVMYLHGSFFMVKFQLQQLQISKDRYCTYLRTHSIASPSTTSQILLSYIKISSSQHTNL